MNKKIRVLSAALMASSLAANIIPIHAEEPAEHQVTKTESVYAVLENDGSVSDIIVSDQLHSDNGFKNYQDISFLSDVENLKSDEEIKKNENGYVWNTDKKDIYYQGKSTKQLPLDVKITYELDGKKMSEEELLGKNGHVKITLNVENKEKHTYVANGRSYELAIPFLTVAGGMFDLDHFSNLTINHGSVQSDSSHDIALGLFVPGLRAGLEEVLDQDMMSDLADYLYDSITIEADATDYVSPSLMMAASTNMSALQDELGDRDLTSVFDQLDELEDATNQLVNGTQSVYDGAVALNKGVGDAKNGAAQLAEGSASLTNGADQLYDGAQKVNGGVIALVSGLETLNASNGTLNNGASALSDGVFKLANTVLASQGLPAINASNYASVLAGQFDVTDAMIEQARAQIASQVAAVNGSPLSADDLAKLLYYAATSGDQSFSAQNLTNAASALKQAKTAAAQVADAAAKAANGLGDPATAQLIASIHSYLAANPTAEQASQAYANVLASVKANQTVVGTLNSFGFTTDEQITAGCEQVIAYAVEHHGAAALSDPACIAEALQAYGMALAAGEPFMETTGMANAAVSQVCYGLAANAIASLSDEQVYGQLIQEIMAMGVDQNTAALVLTYGANYGSYDSSKTPAAFLSETAAGLMNLRDLNNVLEANYNTPETQQLVNSKLADLYIAAVAGNDDLKSMKALLDGTLALQSGIAQYTAGAQSALNGARTLSAGTATLSNGAKTLSDGAKKLQSGADKLNNGMTQLQSGSTQLADGTKTLLDGMTRYNNEAISKLTRSSKIKTLEETSQLLNVVRDQGQHYNNYSGIADDAEGSIKFVFKINGAKKAAKTTEETTSTKESKSFWQRVVGLFDFGSNK